MQNKLLPRERAREFLRKIVEHTEKDDKPQKTAMEIAHLVMTRSGPSPAMTWYAIRATGVSANTRSRHE